MTQITVKPHVGVTEDGFERVARAISSLPQTHHREIMEALEKLQYHAKINLCLSVLTLTLLCLHDRRTAESVERMARQVAATLNLPDQDFEEAVQYCVQNAALAEALSTEQEGTAQASTSAPTSRSGKSGGKKG